MNYNWLDNFKGVKVDFTPDFSDYGYWAFLDNEGMLVIEEVIKPMLDGIAEEEIFSWRGV